MKPRWPVRRIVGYVLAVVAVTAGIWLLRDRLASFDPIHRFARLDLFGFGRPVTLTGMDRRGRLEVPVINLWERPGFDRANQVVARVPLPTAGQLEARLMNQIEFGGLTWDEVRVGTARGWVLSRFVSE